MTPQPPAAPETRYPTGAIIPERQRCICDGVCLDHCRACNHSGRDLEEPCIADPDWEPDDEYLAIRTARLRVLSSPPAAPETETDANGRLTADEREVLLDVAYAYANPFNDDNPTPEREGVVACVEHILRERVRVVEGERDRYRSAWKSAATRAGIAADYAEANRRHAAAPVDGLCQTCGCGVDGDGDCPCGCIEEAERAREAFALGAAWALGDDEEAPAALRARAESAEAEVARLQAVVNQGAAGAVCPDLRTHGERVHRIVAEAESAEAAREAEKAALTALADRFDGYGHGVYCTHMEEQLPCSTCHLLADLRSLLGGGEAR